MPTRVPRRSISGTRSIAAATSPLSIWLSVISLANFRIGERRRFTVAEDRPSPMISALYCWTKAFENAGPAFDTRIHSKNRASPVRYDRRECADVTPFSSEDKIREMAERAGEPCTLLVFIDDATSS